MKKLSLKIQTKPFSSYISICGSLTGIDAMNLKGKLSEICHTGKDLYIDIKDLEEIDISGLSALLFSMQHTLLHGSDTYIFVDKGNPIFTLMEKIKFTNQLNFRDCFIYDSYIAIAS